MHATVDTAPPTHAEVWALAKEIADFMKGDPWKDGWEAYHKHDEAFWARITALDDRAGDTLAIGSLVQFSYADGRASCIVHTIKAKTVLVYHIGLGDGWHDGNIVTTNHQNFLSINRQVAERAVNGRRALKKLFSRSES